MAVKSCLRRCRQYEKRICQPFRYAPPGADDVNERTGITLSRKQKRKDIRNIDMEGNTMADEFNIGKLTPLNIEDELKQSFISFAMAVINVRKYRKFGSPVYNASRAISLASACVSMLTLESTMLTTFGDGTMDVKTRQIFLCASGIAVSLVIILMAVYIICQGTKKRKLE